MTETSFTAAELECSPMEDLASYAFGLDDERCRAVFENRDRLWITYQVNYSAAELRNDYVLSDALFLH